MAVPTAGTPPLSPISYLHIRSLVNSVPHAFSITSLVSMAARPACATKSDYDAKNIVVWFRVRGEGGEEDPLCLVYIAPPEGGVHV